MGKHGSQIKNDKAYEAMRKKGMSKNKAARVSNAQAASKKTSVKGGKAPSYEESTKDELLAKARKVGIEGRSRMNKRQLVKALRNH